MTSTHDVVIVGSGIVGSSLACALAQKTSLNIALLESNLLTPNWSLHSHHHRVSAINLFSQQFFQSLNVWNAIQKKRVSPFTQIEVWDHHSKNKIDFNSADIAESVLGYIIENNLIQSVLLEQIKKESRLEYIAPVNIKHINEEGNGIILQTENHYFKAPLIVAADGMHSWLRQQIGIDIVRKDYHQEAIVATVTTEQVHQKIARQVFLSTGPLAFLPLRDEYTSSIVWSLPASLAQEYLALTTSEFKQILNDAFSFEFGDVVGIEERFSFPLCQQQVQQYIKPHFALVGDAAHTVHPLAGLGLNMGLRDVVRLTNIIENALSKRRAFSDFSVLRRYERQSKADNFPFFLAIDGLKTFFAKNNPMVRSMRSLGLKTFNHNHFLKNLFMRFATTQ